MDDASVTVFFFNGLHADTCVDETPIFFPCIGKEGFQFLHTCLHALSALLNQIANEWNIVQADLDQRGDVVGADGAGKVGELALDMEELTCPSGVGAEEN